MHRCLVTRLENPQFQALCANPRLKPADLWHVYLYRRPK